MAWNEENEKQNIKDKIEGISKIYNRYMEVINAYFSEEIQVTNLSLTYENKINEIAEKFKESGLSFYGYSTLKNAIVRKLGKYIEDACNSLEEFCEFIAQEPEETALIITQETGFIKMFHTLRNFFFKGSIERKRLKEIKEKETEAKIYIEKYEIANKKIAEYSLENDAVITIIEFVKDTYEINYQMFKGDVADIEEEFAKLGFERHIDVLESELESNGLELAIPKREKIS